MESMPSTRITWHDALQAPDDGKRYEAIEGALFVTPAPSVRHQWVSFNLERELDRWLVRPGHGLVFHAPVGDQVGQVGQSRRFESFNQHVLPHNSTLAGSTPILAKSRCLIWASNIFHLMSWNLSP